MAEALGREGKTAVAECSGMSRNTVIKAEREVSEGIEQIPVRQSVASVPPHGDQYDFRREPESGER